MNGDAKGFAMIYLIVSDHDYGKALCIVCGCRSFFLHDDDTLTCCMCGKEMGKVERREIAT